MVLMGAIFAINSCIVLFPEKSIAVSAKGHITPTATPITGERLSSVIMAAKQAHMTAIML
jgi:hypothetical protein